MYRDFLKRINFLLFFMIALFAATLQSTIFSYHPLQFFKPDIFLIMIAYMGFRRGVLEGAALTILGSIALEAHSSTAVHYFLTVNIYVFVAAKILSKTVVVPDAWSSIGIVAALTLAKKVGLLILLSLTGDAGDSFKAFLVYVIPTIAVQAVLTPMLFFWFTRIDMKTYKNEHAEDEYDLSI